MVFSSEFSPVVEFTDEVVTVTLSDSQALTFTREEWDTLLEEVRIGFDLHQDEMATVDAMIEDLLIARLPDTVPAEMSQGR
ncbi:hypothetical protein [Rhodococcus sovatensis]|uniref:Uncharacterized protein n=1 Tax=Rhodococcus sovatensis TaxID=1805840 RepID=A0ABZ2PME9_9NOCA